MIKKLIVLGTFCLMINALYAQKISIDLNNEKVYNDKVSPKVKADVEEFSEKIRKIVQEEKALMDDEINEIEQQLKDKSTTSTDAETQKKEVAKKYADRINTRIQDLGFDLDDVIQKQVEYSILDNAGKIEDLTIDELKKKYSPTNEVHGYISWGVMNLADNDHQGLNNHLGFSSNFEIGLIAHKQFNRTSPLELITGLVFSWRTLRLDDDYMFDRAENGIVDIVQHSGNLEKSKLRGTYIMVPLGLKYNFTKLKNITPDFQYRSTEGGLGLGMNLYGGIKISNNNIVKGDGIKMREKGSSYNLNNFVFGAQATLSFNSVNLFVRQDFTSYFKDNTFDDRKMLQFGLNFGF